MRSLSRPPDRSLRQHRPPGLSLPARKTAGSDDRPGPGARPIRASAVPTLADSRCEKGADVTHDPVEASVFLGAGVRSLSSVSRVCGPTSSSRSTDVSPTRACSSASASKVSSQRRRSLIVAWTAIAARNRHANSHTLRERTVFNCEPLHGRSRIRRHSEEFAFEVERYRSWPRFL